MVEAVSTVSTITGDTRADHEGRSLSRHSEATGIDTIVLSQLERRAIDGCGRHFTLCRRDADLHLVVLVQRRTRSNGVAIMSDSRTTATAGYDLQRIAALLVLITLLAALLTAILRTTVL